MWKRGEALSPGRSAVLLTAAGALSVLLAASNREAAGELEGEAYPSRAEIVEADGSGAIAGTVDVVGVPVSGGPPRLSPYSRQRYRPPTPSVGGGRVEDVVVYVSSVSSGGRLPDAVVEIHQRDQTILPHVTVVQVGTEVSFPNDDEIYHNLFSLSEPKRFNLGRYPPGESRSIVFDRPGVVRLFCDIHSDMSGVIMVVEPPYFATPSPDGSFRIEGVPAGPHTVVAWHERLPPDSVEVDVPAGGSAQVDFRLGG